MMTPKEKLGIAIGALIVATWTSGIGMGLAMARWGDALGLAMMAPSALALILLGDYIADRLFPLPSQDMAKGNDQVKPSPSGETA